MESKVDGAEKPAVHLTRMALFVAYLLYVIVVPHRLYDVYMADGLSLRFAHFILSAFVLALSLAGLSDWIGIDALMILLIPAVIGYIATYEWNVATFIAVVVALVVYIIVFVVLVSCDKNGDMEDIPLPVSAKEVSCDKNWDVKVQVSCDKNGDVKDIPLSVGAKEENV